MKLGPALRVDPALSRTVTLVDLLLTALLVFLVFPVALYVAGLMIAFLAAENGALHNVAELLMGIGGIGVFAWVGAPFAMLVGWLATRIGWIGWAAAPGAGLVGAILLGIATMIIEGETLLAYEASFILLFMPFGAVFGVLGWMALRFLRPDLYVGGAN